MLRKDWVREKILAFLKDQANSKTQAVFSISDLAVLIWKSASDEYRKKYMGQLPQDARNMIAEIVWGLVIDRVLVPFYNSCNKLEPESFFISDENRHKLVR